MPKGEKKEVKFENESKEIENIGNTIVDIDGIKQLNEKIKYFKELQLNCEKALLMQESFNAIITMENKLNEIIKD